MARLLKGVYHLRTPVPRYSSTWDVAKVTIYLRTLFPLEQLNLKTVPMKTVMLCALSKLKESRRGVHWILTLRNNLKIA